MIFVTNEGGKLADCTRPYAAPLLECFFKRGIHVAIKTMTEETNLSRILGNHVHRIGVVLILDDIDLNQKDNFLYRVN